VIAVDTNVLVRVITNDDPAQASRAAKLLVRPDRVFVPKTVVLELEWVLRSGYGIDRQGIAAAIHRLQYLSNVEIEDDSIVALALAWYEAGMDFADGLHLASAGPGLDFATFDVALRKRARRLGLKSVASV
jgi:predicted nucleic-acid-binding protein